MSGVAASLFVDLDGGAGKERAVVVVLVVVVVVVLCVDINGPLCCTVFFCINQKRASTQPNPNPTTRTLPHIQATDPTRGAAPPRVFASL